MKKHCIIFPLLLLLCTTFAFADITENFNTLTGGSWSASSSVSLASGEWTFSGMSVSSKQLKFNQANAYIISPAVDSVCEVRFDYRAGGGNKHIYLAYSVGGAAWVDVSSVTVFSSTNTYTTATMPVELSDTKNIRFRFLATESNSYIDNVVFKQTKESTGGNGGGVVIPGEDDPDFKRPTFVAKGNTYYISPEGNDATGDGSFEQPWYNLGKAVSVARAGDVIYCRGGRYRMSWRGTDNKLTIRLSESGTSDAPIVISAYENEAPVFDFEQQLLDCNRDKSKVGDRGMLISGDYWILFGLHMMHAADNAIKLEGNHNRIERCEFSYNLDTGIQLGFGHDFSQSGFGSSNDGTHCAYNDIIDCDSHHNCDFDQNYGSDADGFACKMHNGRGNRFIRCRAWRNSDDAWDLYETDYDVVLVECWAWESGNAADHLWPKEYLDGNASFSGNGNGIKLGGNGSGGSSKGIHYAYRCVAFGCDKSGSVKGFDCNSHKGGHVLVNCLAFDNGYDYMFESGGSEANTHFYNNVCFGRQEICVGDDSHNAIVSPMSKQGWTNDVVTGFSRADYQSLSEEDAIAPRRADGSMPARFARLMPDSRLVDAGTTPPAALMSALLAVEKDCAFSYSTVYGTALDMGPYELPKDDNLSTGTQQIVSPESKGDIVVLQNGGANEVIVRFSVPQDTRATLAVYDLSGLLVYTADMGTITYGVDYYRPVPVAVSGMYIVRLTAGNFAAQTKFIVR